MDWLSQDWIWLVLTASTDTGSLEDDRMYPVLVQLGTFELRSYGIIVALSFFLGLWLSARKAKRTGVNFEHDLA